jgi:SAM-dependent methyltransferase
LWRLLYLSRRHRPRIAVGVDVSVVAVRRGRRLGVDLRQGEAARLSFEDRHFDCLVCVDALNYFVEAEFVREAVRVLKPSGRLVLAESSRSFAEAEGRFQRLARLGGWPSTRSGMLRTEPGDRFASATPRLRVPSPGCRPSCAAAWATCWRSKEATEYCFAMAVLRPQSLQG